MITGVVQSDEVRVRLEVIGLRGRKQKVDAVVDTGNTASLTLPRALIAALRLRWRSVDRGTLAEQQGDMTEETRSRLAGGETTLAPPVSAPAYPARMRILNGRVHPRGARRIDSFWRSKISREHTPWPTTD
jgi:hypothetical protein